MKRSKASRAKKAAAAAAATRNTAPSPRQEVERQPWMPAWLSAIVQRFQTVPVGDTTATTSGVARGVRERKKRVQGGYQAEMYRARLQSPGARVWNQKPANRHVRPGPTIEELNAKDDEVVNPYEQKARHIDYLAIRATSKPDWDFCSACYIEKSYLMDAKKTNLNKHFETKHLGQARKSCSICTAVFLTEQLKWHTKYSHPGIAVE